MFDNKNLGDAKRVERFDPDRLFGPGFVQNEDGSWSPALAGALFVNAEDQIELRTDGVTLVQEQGSPVTLKSPVSEQVLRVQRILQESDRALSNRLTAALDGKASVASVDALTAEVATKMDSSHALRLTESISPATGEGVEIVEAPSMSAPVIRPFSNGAAMNLDLRLFGLGTGVVEVNGDVPATSTALDALDDRVVVLEAAPPAHNHAASEITSGTLDIARIPTGSTGSTVCIGNDSRLSDARPPTAHNHAASEITSGTIAEARLGTGTGTAVKVLRGDSTWRPIGLSVTFHALSSAQASWASMPLAATLLAGHHRHIARADLTGYTQCRLHVNKMGTAGVAGAKLILRYRTSFSTTASDYSDAGTSEVSCAIDATDTFVSSSWIDLASSAKGDVFLAIVGSGGNGATSPQYGGIHAEFR